MKYHVRCPDCHHDKSDSATEVIVDSGDTDKKKANQDDKKKGEEQEGNIEDVVVEQQCNEKDVNRADEMDDGIMQQEEELENKSEKGLNDDNNGMEELPRGNEVEKEKEEQRDVDNNGTGEQPRKNAEDEEEEEEDDEAKRDFSCIVRKKDVNDKFFREQEMIGDFEGINPAEQRSTCHVYKPRGQILSNILLLCWDMNDKDDSFGMEYLNSDRFDNLMEAQVLAVKGSGGMTVNKNNNDINLNAAIAEKGIY